MPDDPIDLDSRRPHEYGWVTCPWCMEQWVAVRPVGTMDLECPRCGARGARAAETPMTEEQHLIARLRDRIDIALRIATDECTCGGTGPGEGCGYNDIWHALTNGTDPYETDA